MAFTNAERQRRWRKRRQEEYAKLLSSVNVDPPEPDDSVTPDVEAEKAMPRSWYTRARMAADAAALIEQYALCKPPETIPLTPKMCSALDKVCLHLGSAEEAWKAVQTTLVQAGVYPTPPPSGLWDENGDPIPLGVVREVIRRQAVVACGISNLLDDQFGHDWMRHISATADDLARLAEATATEWGAVAEKMAVRPRGLKGQSKPLLAPGEYDNIFSCAGAPKTWTRGTPGERIGLVIEQRANNTDPGILDASALHLRDDLAKKVGQDWAQYATHELVDMAEQASAAWADLAKHIREGKERQR